MRICQPDIALDNVWHILEVLEGSPAESAGLVPYGDWIVGWAGGVLQGENDFLEVVENVSLCIVDPGLAAHSPFPARRKTLTGICLLL